MASTGDTPADPPASGDDINDRLAEIAAELGSQATFKEPSAADRARARPYHAQAQPEPPVRTTHSISPLRRMRNRRTAAMLRRPVQSTSGTRPASRSGHPARRRSVRLWLRQLTWRLAARRRRAAGRPHPVPDRGYATATASTPGRSLLIVVAAMVALIAFCAIVLSVLNHP